MIRRLGVGLAVISLLTLGALAASTAVASAGTLGSCSASSPSGVLAICTARGLAMYPITITATLTASPAQSAGIAWTDTCTEGDTTRSSSGSFDAETPFTHTIPHVFYQPSECSIVVSAGLDFSSGSIYLSISVTPSVHEIRGYNGKCADDTGNSSHSRTKIQIWTCNGAASQNWMFHGGELVHNGECMNDLNSGGSGSKVILFACDHAPNEIWTHNSRSEYVLKAHDGKLCLDDPGAATRNGTQLVVYTCNNGADQHWSVP